MTRQMQSAVSDTSHLSLVSTENGSMVGKMVACKSKIAVISYAQETASELAELMPPYKVRQIWETVTVSND